MVSELRTIDVAPKLWTGRVIATLTGQVLPGPYMGVCSVFTEIERKAVSQLIKAAERVLNETDANTREQVNACRELHTLLMAITAVVDDATQLLPPPPPPLPTQR